MLRDDELSTQFGDVPDPTTGGAALATPRFLAGDVPPTRAVVRRRRKAALAFSVAWVGGRLAVYGVRPDLAALPPLYVAVQIVVPALLALASLGVLIAPGRLGLGARLGLVTTLVVLGPLAFALLAIGAPIPQPLPAGAASLIGILVCFDITIGWALVPLALAALVFRHAFPAAAGWRSALVGATAGLFAGAVMNLHCPNLAPAHMLFGHAFPVLLATLAGGLLVAKRTRI